MRLFLLILLTAVNTSACQQAAPALEQPTTMPSAATKPQIAKIVFVDQVEACDCTQKRIAGTWTALQTALGTPAKVTVERIHLDTEAAKAEAYTLLKPFNVAPGVYFLDAGNAVVEMLQGELTVEQLAAVLKG
jgi:hypothetical protein